MKKLTLFFAVLILVLSSVNVPARAEEPPVTPDIGGLEDRIINIEGLLQELLRNQGQVGGDSGKDAEISNLQSQLESLRRQLEDAKKPENNPVAPKIKLQSVPNINVNAGGVSNASFTFVNVGDSSAKSVVTQVYPTGDVPFTVEIVKNGSLSLVNKDEKVNVDVKFIVTEEAKEGTYDVTFRHTYKNTYGAFVEDTNLVKVKVIVPPGLQVAKTGSAMIQGISVDKANIYPGDVFNLSATVANLSPTEVSEVQVILDGLESEKIFLNTSTDGIFYNKLNSGQKHELVYELKASPKLKAGSYKLTFTTKYKDNTGTAKETSSYYYVSVLDNGSSSSNGVANISVIDVVAPNLEEKKPNEDFDITLTFKNTGVNEAKNIKVTSTVPEGKLVPKSANTSSIQVLAPGETASVNFKFAATEAALSQNYTISFKTEYDAGMTVDNTVIKESFEQFVGVNIKNSKSAVIECDVIGTNSTFLVGNKFPLTLRLTNASDIDLNDIKISTVLPELIVPASANMSIVSLEANETKDFSFEFMATSKAKTQNYPIGFKIEYGSAGAEGGKNVVEQYTGVNIENPNPEETPAPDTVKVSKPKVIIESYICEPILVKAGQKFEIDMTFKNTHPTKSVNNIKMTYTAIETTDNKGSVFTPLNGSNTVFLGEIKPNGTVSKKLELFTVPDAASRTYPIAVKFQYQDEENNEYTEEEQIGITVTQVTKLETSDISFPTMSFPFNPVYLYFSLYNTGKVNLSNLKVQIVAENPDAFDTSNATVYFGALNKGNSAYYDGSFSPKEAGEHKAKLIISYEDDTGEKYEDVREFSMNVQEMMMEPMEGKPGGPMGFEPEISEKSLGQKAMDIVKNPWVWVGILASFIIIVGLSMFIKKRRQKGFEFND